MEKQIVVESFALDHNTVYAPYVRVAGIEERNGAVIQKFDLRFLQPNGDALPTAAIHTMEHFLATFMREKIDGLVDISPMGCRTGFYMVVWDEHDPQEVADALTYALEKIMEQVDIPATTDTECGNYRDHSLFAAQEYTKQILTQGISIDPFTKR